MRRTYYLLLIAIGVIVFLAISVLLARVFGSEGAERSAITALVQAEGRGDSTATVALITGCSQSPACRARAVQNAAALKRPGTVSILQLNTSAGFSLTGTLGTARVAWKTPSSLPIVQCVRVRHAGNALSGLHIELLEISQRIASDALCPARY